VDSRLKINQPTLAEVPTSCSLLSLAAVVRLWHGSQAAVAAAGWCSAGSMGGSPALPPPLARPALALVAVCSTLTSGIE
jgi:hypothetical protein